jgi:hypothetical protein
MFPADAMCLAEPAILNHSRLDSNSSARRVCPPGGYGQESLCSHWGMLAEAGLQSQHGALPFGSLANYSSPLKEALGMRRNWEKGGEGEERER